MISYIQDRHISCTTLDNYCKSHNNWKVVSGYCSRHNYTDLIIKTNSQNIVSNILIAIYSSIKYRTKLVTCNDTYLLYFNKNMIILGELLPENTVYYSLHYMLFSGDILRIDLLNDNKKKIYEKVFKLLKLFYPEMY